MTDNNEGFIENFAAFQQQLTKSVNFFESKKLWCVCMIWNFKKIEKLMYQWSKILMKLAFIYLTFEYNFYPKEYYSIY